MKAVDPWKRLNFLIVLKRWDSGQPAKLRVNVEEDWKSENQNDEGEDDGCRL